MCLVIMVQKQFPNLPPVQKISDVNQLNEYEQKELNQAIKEGSISLANKFSTSVYKTFGTFSDATSDTLSVNN